MLYGAIIGDIAGSIYEFNNIKYKPNLILTDDMFFTDDTVMTIAVADAINHGELEHVDKYMRWWGTKYPDRGYGGHFAAWLDDWSMGPYNSYGNGSAMRVSAAGWAAKSLREAWSMAIDTATVTHNHPEGIRGAEAVAVAIYLAKEGISKEEIKEFIEQEYKYVIRECDEIRPTYKFDETCQGTVPEAFSAFVESKDFEDCIRIAISLGGDSDTLAAIAGSVAEAYYGIPQNLKNKCRKYLRPDMLEVIDKFEEEWRQ